MGRFRFGASGTVSRVLSFKAIICLGKGLLLCSRHPSKYRPSKPLSSVLLRIGFTGRKRLRCAGELLPRLSTLTRVSPGGISLLHFPLRSPSAAVSRYPALRSPDFPHISLCVIAHPARTDIISFFLRNVKWNRLHRRTRGKKIASGSFVNNLFMLFM